MIQIPFSVVLFFFFTGATSGAACSMAALFFGQWLRARRDAKFAREITEAAVELQIEYDRRADQIIRNSGKLSGK